MAIKKASWLLKVCIQVPSEDLKALGNQQHRPRGTIIRLFKGVKVCAHSKEHRSICTIKIAEIEGMYILVAFLRWYLSWNSLVSNSVLQIFWAFQAMWIERLSTLWKEIWSLVKHTNNEIEHHVHKNAPPSTSLNLEAPTAFKRAMSSYWPQIIRMQWACRTNDRVYKWYGYSM